MKTLTILSILIICCLARISSAAPDSLITIPSSDCFVYPFCEATSPCLMPIAPPEDPNEIGVLCCCYGIELKNNGADPFCELKVKYNTDDSVCGICSFSEPNWYWVPGSHEFTIKTDNNVNWMRSGDVLRFTICARQRRTVGVGIFSIELINCIDNSKCKVLTAPIPVGPDHCSINGYGNGVATISKQLFYLSDPYPNPSTEYVQFDCYQERSGPILMQVVNREGMILEKKEITVGGEKGLSVRVATSSLPVGSYTVTFSAPSFFESRSFIVTH